MIAPTDSFSPDCKRCRRLAGFLRDIRAKHPLHYAKAVPSFGSLRPRLLVVGLAPGLHGANRTGRPFTGDHAGLLLYRTLHRFGFATSEKSLFADDGLQLIDCRITNAVRCVPPENKPNPEEIRTCNDYLREELSRLAADGAILALGNVAHGAVLAASGVKPARFRFGHGAQHVLPAGVRLFDSYHCSRYNTQTGRLTEEMFVSVFADIAACLDRAR